MLEQTESSKKKIYFEAFADIALSAPQVRKIQVTGDIFFPKRWLGVTFANYRSSTDHHTVSTFLEKRPDYNDQLRMKILQSTDTLLRANKLSLADEKE